MAPVLGYWEIRGLATPIRLLLEHAGVEYEEKLYKSGPLLEASNPPVIDRSDWLNEKFSLGLDFPNLPYYIDGDVKVTQSHVILRYLARKYSLGGKNDLDTTRIDLLASQVYDNHMQWCQVAYNPNFLQMKEEYLANLPAKLEALSKFLGENKFVAGDYVTYADFVLFEYLEGQLNLAPEILKDLPILDQFHKRILAFDSVDKYFKSPKAVKQPFNGPSAYFGGAYSEQLLKR